MLDRSLSVLRHPALLGGITVLFGVITLRMGFWRGPERVLQSAWVQIKGPAAWDPRLALVEIDEASLEQLGPLPLPRRTYGDLMERLRESDPDLVVLDVDLFSPDIADQALAQQIEQQTVILPRALSPWLSNSTLEEAATKWAVSAAAVPGFDFAFQKYPMLSEDQQVMLALTREARSLTERDVQRVAERHGLGWMLPKAHMAELLRKLAEVGFRDDRQAPQVVERTNLTRLDSGSLHQRTVEPDVAVGLVNEFLQPAKLLSLERPQWPTFGQQLPA